VLAEVVVADGAIRRRSCSDDDVLDEDVFALGLLR
jgi:hypothetical protein